MNSALAAEISRLCLEVQPNLHKYQREVACCRRRIGQFLKSFDDSTAAEAAMVDLGLGRYLLPAGCRTLAEAVARLLDSMTPNPSSPYADIGRNVIRAIASYAGKPVALLCDGREATAHALIDSRPFTIAPPGR